MPFSNNQGQLTSKSKVPNLELVRHFMVVLVNYKNEECVCKAATDWPHHPQYKSMFFPKRSRAANTAIS